MLQKLILNKNIANATDIKSFHSINLQLPKKDL